MSEIFKISDIFDRKPLEGENEQFTKDFGSVKT